MSSKERRKKSIKRETSKVKEISITSDDKFLLKVIKKVIIFLKCI